MLQIPLGLRVAAISLTIVACTNLMCGTKYEAKRCHTYTQPVLSLQRRNSKWRGCYRFVIIVADTVSRRLSCLLILLL
ncbi:hypothetical protein HDV64DRAFT_237530 [Trichoderma sp. TUCIM 5745]